MTSALPPITVTITDGVSSRSVLPASLAAALALSSAQVSWALRYLLAAAALPPGPSTMGEPTEGATFRNVSERTFQNPKENTPERNVQNVPDAPVREGSALASALALALDDHASLANYEKLTRTHPAALLEEAARRVQTIPPERIAKSRGAVFMGIVRRLAALRASGLHSSSTPYARTPSSPP